MKHILWLFLAFIFISSNTFSQSMDTITVRQGLWSSSYYYDGKPIKGMKDIGMAVRNNPEAYSKMESAKTLSTVSSIFGFAGIILIGYPIVTEKKGEEPNWFLVYSGGCMIIFGLLFDAESNGNIHDAVDIYNSSIQKAGKPKDTTTLDFYLAPTRVGLALRF